MMPLLRAELRKLTSTRLLVGLFAAGAALVLLVSWLTLWGPPVGGTVQVEGVAEDPLATAADLRSLLEVVGALNVFALVLGIIVVTGEFRHGTAAATFLAEPRRVRVLAVKTVVCTGAGVAYAAAASVLVLATAWLYAATHGIAVPWDGTVAETAGLLAASTGLAAGLGAGIGAAVRSQIAAIVGVLVWMFLGETLIGSFVPDLARWLPFGAGTGMVSSTPGMLSTGTAAAVSLAYVAVAVAAGAVTLRRDVV